jgi:hypothetical protein
MSRRRGGHHGVPLPGLEVRGGYPSPSTPVPVLPRVPAGPAPGARGADARPAAPCPG